MNVPLILKEKGNSVQPRLRGINLVTQYGLPERYCLIPIKGLYINDDTWASLVNMVAPGIRKLR